MTLYGLPVLPKESLSTGKGWNPMTQEFMHPESKTFWRKDLKLSEATFANSSIVLSWDYRERAKKPFHCYGSFFNLNWNFLKPSRWECFSYWKNGHNCVALRDMHFTPICCEGQSRNVKKTVQNPFSSRFVSASNMQINYSNYLPLPIELSSRLVVRTLCGRFST